MGSAPAVASTAFSAGWITQAELNEMIAAVRSWASREDAFAAWLYCAALGWVD